jgi:tetratricopeptide (TPR) repeat protein
MHPDIATTLNNIGNVCFANGEYDQALQHFERTLDIFKISLPSEHPSIAKTYYNMGLAYFNKDDYQRSLVFLNRAASIYLNTLSPDHPEVHRCVNTIDFIKQIIPTRIKMNK